jgi:hypothetical protein
VLGRLDCLRQPDLDLVVERAAVALRVLAYPLVQPVVEPHAHPYLGPLTPVQVAAAISGAGSVCHRASRRLLTFSGGAFVVPLS